MSRQGLRDFVLSKEELAVARQLTKRFGTSYFFATLLFSKKLRHATFVLYAFFRIPDEYVDQGLSKKEAAQRLQLWHKAWKTGLFENVSLTASEKLILQAARRVFKEVSMPEEYSDAFLKAMEQDLSTDSYETYKDLRGYMYGSAAVVGLMMTELIGYTNNEAIQYAQKLGEAMQLTNFLRDIGEDWEERGRIYLPKEDLLRFGVKETDIANKKITPEFIELMKFEIDRARALYQEAEKGIAMLRPAGQKPVRAALVLYRGILNEIEANNYDSLNKRARTSFYRKIYLLTPVLLKI